MSNSPAMVKESKALVKESRARQPLTAMRKQVFLDHLRIFGIPQLAAKAASPLSPNGAFATFRDAASRDPVFHSLWQDAQSTADSTLEKTAYDRAVTGWSDPIFQGGVRCVDESGKPAVIQRYDSKLLLKLLQRRDPKAWADRSSLEVSGSVSTGESALRITVQDLMSLGEEDRTDLSRILHRLAIARGEIDPQTIDAEVLPNEEQLSLESQTDQEAPTSLSEDDQRTL